ncbi:MAG: PEP-CTERM sorting domain-containing protein [Sedimentisphaerales bacterium]|nr:PEP-CTERM sorting domain-containing protein [Sedimentisphaerales bacterium]
MKKLLAMLLVLGLASVASAAMSFDLVPTPPGGGHGFNPQDPLMPSEWVELDIVYSGGVPLWTTGGLTVKIEGPAEWCGPDADAYLPVPGIPIEEAWTVLDKFTPGYMYLGVINFPGINSMVKVDSRTLVLSGATDLNKAIAVLDGEILFDHLNIHCTGPGEVVVTLTPSVSTVEGIPTFWDGDLLVEDLNALGSEITIYQAPEPMTMALLGLGGLALIRRRR